MISATAELNTTQINTPQEKPALQLVNDAPGIFEHLSIKEKQQFLSNYGNQSSAYFTLQPGVSTFGDKARGYIAFRRQSTVLGRVNIVFCNPICSSSQLSELIASFLLNTPGKTIFMGIDKEVASCLQQHGYRLNQMGTEFSINLSHFEVKGKEKKHLRHAANLGKRHGLSVRELEWEDIDQNAVHQISEQWRAQKAVNSRELKLLTRPPAFRNEWKVRKFYCFQGEKLLGYVFFDPYFKNGKIIGYCANIIRKDPTAKPSDLLDYIILEAINTFRSEGIQQLSLGISPLYNIEKEDNDRPALRVIQRFLFENGNTLYAFKPLAYHKTRYRGDETKWYVCTRNISITKTVLAILQGTQLVPKTKAAKNDALQPIPVS